MLIPVLIFWLQRVSRRVTYEVVNWIPLLRRHDYLRDQVEVLVKGQPVDDPAIVEVVIANTGNSPIRAADIERPISIQFGKNARVLAADVTRTEPADLGVEIELGTSSIALSGSLLNAGDKVHIRILGSGFTAVSVSGRIAGIRRIYPASNLAAAVLAAMGAALGVVGLVSWLSHPKT